VGFEVPKQPSTKMVICEFGNDEYANVHLMKGEKRITTNDKKFNRKFMMKEKELLPLQIVKGFTTAHIKYI
jgi:hypothetical protein